MTILDELDSLYTDLANFLGELAGNEAYLEVIDKQLASGTTIHGPVALSFDWAFDFPGTYGFRMYHQYKAADPQWSPPGTPVPPEVAEQLVLEAEKAWSAAYNQYSAGAERAQTLRQLAQSVWEPDATAMQQGVDSLKTAALLLFDEAKPGGEYQDPADPNAPDWLKNLKAGWPATSESSESFYDFWNDVNDKCALYLLAMERLASSSARATVAVHDFQLNLLEITRSAKEHVETSLKQWQEFKGPSGLWPDGTHSGLRGILSDASYHAGVLGMFTGPVAGWISVFTGTLSYIVPDISFENVSFVDVATAPPIWDAYHNDVATLVKNMHSVLEAIKTQPPHAPSSASESQGLQSFVADVVANHRDWSLPQVNL